MFADMTKDKKKNFVAETCGTLNFRRPGRPGHFFGGEVGPPPAGERGFWAARLSVDRPNFCLFFFFVFLEEDEETSPPLPLPKKNPR